MAKNYDITVVIDILSYEIPSKQHRDMLHRIETRHTRHCPGDGAVVHPYYGTYNVRTVIPLFTTALVTFLYVKYCRRFACKLQYYRCNGVSNGEISRRYGIGEISRRVEIRHNNTDPEKKLHHAKDILNSCNPQQDS